MYLVGAGPGAPDLISLRGLRALRAADLIIIDSLLPRAFLNDLAIPTAGKTVVWLQPGETLERHDEINRRMVEAAQAGQVVARLKGGDPFVFGRAKSEVDFLTAHGVAWEVIPGATVATVGPAAAGLQLTSRDAGRSFAVVTGRLAGGALNDDCPRADSLVVFMGVGKLREISANLIGGGWDPKTRAVVIERSTLPWERRAGGELREIADVAARLNIAPPAILLIGAVVDRASAFAGLPQILFAGTENPAPYRQLGDILHWPALELVPLTDNSERIAGVLSQLATRHFQNVVFCGPAAARLFFQAVAEQGRDARVLAGIDVLAVGNGTAEQLAEHGIRADAVSRDEQEIVHVLPSRLRPRSRLLLIGEQEETENVQAALASLDKEIAITSVPLVKMRINPDLGRPLPQFDVVLFTDPREVRAYHDAYGADAFRHGVWCAGHSDTHSHSSQDELRRLGYDGEIIQVGVEVKSEV